MKYLPALRHEHLGAIALDASDSLEECIRALADLYREDPEAVGDMLVEIADLKDRAELERDLDGLGHAEHCRDELVAELLGDIGGAKTYLDPRVSHFALMQARSLAFEAERIAVAANERANELAKLTAIVRGVKVEKRRLPFC
ncbi:hypothetical protein ACFYOD_06555 [Streptomyces sp. NPDC006703]|uniref:hypothetical protein n=1 Tax=Streptomyces sp. NPDC006703 TaxID=3364759 RepID=UPI003681DB18